MRLGIIRGRVWKFGDNVNTTDITPYELFDQDIEMSRKHIFAAMRPDWREKVKTGDCIVAGDNFGYVSSRPSANEAMLDLKIGCIVANSIARVYYRTAISLGFPAFPCPGVAEIFNEGDELELDVYKGLVKNLTTGERIQGNPYPPKLLDVLEAGGIIPLLMERVRGDES